MFKILKEMNQKETEKNINIDEETNMIIANFQKITSSKIRTLDSKIELADQLIKDLDEIYTKNQLLLSDIQNQNINIQTQNVKKAERKFKSEENIIIPETTAKIPEPVKIKEPPKEKKKEIIDSDIIMDKKQKILSMLKKGMSKEDIAKKLGIGIGEVILVMNLYKE